MHFTEEAFNSTNENWSHRCSGFSLRHRKNVASIHTLSQGKTLHNTKSKGMISFIQQVPEYITVQYVWPPPPLLNIGYEKNYCEVYFTQVIRDKKTAITNGLLKNCKGLYDLRMLVRIVNIPLRLIHVIRNPFDNIATIRRRELHLDPRSRQIVS